MPPVSVAFSPNIRHHHVYRHHDANAVHLSIDLVGADGTGEKMDENVPVWEVAVDDGQEWRPSQEIPQAARDTVSWCRDFVLPLQLCPWVRSSLDTMGALQIFMADTQPNQQLVEDIGYRFKEFLKTSPQVESAAIFFVIFPNCDFADFYSWFDELEDTWELMDEVIVAPFHPDWTWTKGESESLQFEKRSPYPTVSLVSTRVIDAAGEDVTRQIGVQNEKTLLSKSPEDLQIMWNKCIDT